MHPGMNPKKMKRAMKQLGIKQEDVDAQQVIIRLPDKDLVIDQPSVQKVNMMGQETYQVSGDVTEEKREQIVNVSDDDIETVMDQTGVEKETAKQAIIDADYDLAQAVLKLSQ